MESEISEIENWRKRRMLTMHYSTFRRDESNHLTPAPPRSQINDREDDVLCPFVPSSCIAPLRMPSHLET